MSTMRNYYYLGHLIMWTIISAAEGEECQRSVCSFRRIEKMQAAECHDKDIHTFPTCYRTNIEVLDLSYNRIRKLKKGDLKPYSYLKFLYLEDNLISQIDKDAFDDASSSLMVIDLSINDIRDLPPNIFHLPSLNKLYLSQNANMNIVDAVEQAKPIKSPIGRLDISFNELETLPNLGEMVHLLEYNISGNDLLDLTPSHFAGLCNLKYLHNHNMSVFFESNCDCLKVNYWLTHRNVKFQPFECDPPNRDDECNEVINKEDLLVYNQCLDTHKELVLHSRLLKIALPCSIVVILIILAVLYYLYKRKQRRLQREAALAAKSAKETNNLIVQYNFRTKPKAKEYP